MVRGPFYKISKIINIVRLSRYYANTESTFLKTHFSSLEIYLSIKLYLAENKPKSISINYRFPLYDVQSIYIVLLDWYGFCYGIIRISVFMCALCHPAISYSESVQFHDTHLYAIISDYREKSFRQRKEASIPLRNVIRPYSRVERALISMHSLPVRFFPL